MPSPFRILRNRAERIRKRNRSQTVHYSGSRRLFRSLALRDCGSHGDEVHPGNFELNAIPPASELRKALMNRHQWIRSIVLIGLIVLLPGLCAVSAGDAGDTRLRKRIAELEAENRSLRRIIAGIQSALESVPKSTIPTPSGPNGLRILVVPGDWGGSQLADIRKVCESAAGTIAAQLTDDGFAPILVQRGKSAPITLFGRGEGNEYIVRLNTGGRAWAQCAYQFSHEFCHIVCNYRNVKNPQMWFEETLCECASMYAVRRMAVEWKTKPPYSNWKSYSASLESYASDLVKRHADRKDSIAQFYQANLAELEKTATNRELNSYIALKLLPHFETTPSAWQSLRNLNLGPVEENASFRTYLTGWHDRVPKQHQPFIRQLAAEFDIELTSETRTD